MCNTDLFSFHNKAINDKKGFIMYLLQICQINWTITETMEKYSTSELARRRDLGNMLNMEDSPAARPRALGELLLPLQPVAALIREPRAGCKKSLLNY